LPDFLISTLDRYERIEVKSRIKDCESALGKLRRREKGREFDAAGNYSLRSLNDLVGIRVYAFPRSRWLDANRDLRQSEHFSKWEPEPRHAEDGTDALLAFKYFGYCGVSQELRGEVQLVPMLIGLFEDVEHAALYKPSPALRGAGPLMKAHKASVLAALKAFDEEFERLLRADPLK
jgi:hypothetical protein